MMIRNSLTQHRESGWEFRLADPADFMTAFRGSLALPPTVTPVVETIKAPSLATPPTTIKAVAEGTDSSSPANHSTTTKVATAGAATPSATTLTTTEAVAGGIESSSPAPHSPITNAATAGAATPSTPHLARTKAAVTDTTLSSSAPHLIESKTAPGEPTLAISPKKSSKTGPSEENWAQCEPAWPAVFIEAKKGEGSALIDFGDASESGHQTAYSHNPGIEVKGVRAITHSPNSEQSYTGDLLGLDIQPEAGQAMQIQEHPTQSLGERGSIPSIADIHSQLSSFAPLLKDVLEPELVKSFENIMTKLQVQSMAAARTSEPEPDIELPTEAFGRLSIHDNDPAPIPVSVKGSTVAASRSRSTSSSDNLAAVTKDRPVDQPRVRLPPPEVYEVGIAGNFQQDPFPDPGYRISRPHVGINVHEQGFSVPVGISAISPQVPEIDVPTTTADQKMSFEFPLKASKLTRRHRPGPDVKSIEHDEILEGGLSGRSAAGHPAVAIESVRSNFVKAREQLDIALDEEAGDPTMIENILVTNYPVTRRSTINNVGYLKGRDPQPKKENTPLAEYPSTSGTTVNRIDYSKGQALQSKKDISLAGNHSSQAEASGSKPKAVLGEDQPRIGVVAGNVIANPNIIHPAPANTGTMVSTAEHFIPPHARINLGDMATASKSVLADPSSSGILGEVKSQGQLKSDQLDEDEEDDYPLETILKTTFVPSGPSMLNRTGFLRR